MSHLLAIFAIVPIIFAELASNEYSALLNLYDSTNGAYWTYPSGSNQWNFNANQDPCVNNWVNMLLL